MAKSTGDEDDMDADLCRFNGPEMMDNDRHSDIKVSLNSQDESEPIGSGVEYRWKDHREVVIGKRFEDVDGQHEFWIKLRQVHWQRNETRE